MLTEVKKTVHIVVDDMNAVPDETMIQNALNQNVQAMVTTGTMAVLVFDEYGKALKAAGDLRKAEKTYHVWSVDLHFTRRCAFEPSTVSPKSIVQHVDDQCRQMAQALVDSRAQGLLPTGEWVTQINNMADVLHELFQDGMFSLSD